MNTPRYLCSQLVRLVVSEPPGTDTGGDRAERWVNLEEIWGDGAVLGCEDEVANGALVLILSDDLSFEGQVTGVKQEETGWRVEVALSALTPWSIEQWRPEHALDPTSLK